MAKSRERLLAREMRKNGKSLGDIAQIVGVAKSTVGLWCRDIVLTKEQVTTLIKRKGERHVEGKMRAWEWHRNEKIMRLRKYENVGALQIGKISKRELHVLGIALYWAEGSKNDGRVLLTNSDPDMINLYIRWLKECLGVVDERFVCRLTINELHNDRLVEIERHWSKVIHIPLDQFTKTTVIHSKLNKLYRNRKTYYGVMPVYVRKSTNLSYQIMGGINRLKEVGGVLK